MRITRTTLTSAFVIASIAGLPAVAAASSNPTDGAKIRARAAGGSASPPKLPAIVGRRITRGEKALNRAADYADRDLPDRAAKSLTRARSYMSAAWRGATYVIKNAPAAPRSSSSRAHRQARASGSGGSGAVYATAEETGVAVLGYEHDVASASLDLLDGAESALKDAVNNTLFAALNDRDQAIAYIHKRPSPPASDSRLDPKARLSGGGGGGTWDSLMPGIVPDLGDEIQQARGLIGGGALAPDGQQVAAQAKAQILETKDNVNTWWPPLPPD